MNRNIGYIHICTYVHIHTYIHNMYIIAQIDTLASSCAETCHLSQ